MALILASGQCRAPSHIITHVTVTLCPAHWGEEHPDMCDDVQAAHNELRESCRARIVLEDRAMGAVG